MQLQNEFNSLVYFNKTDWDQHGENNKRRDKHDELNMMLMKHDACVQTFKLELL